MSSLISKTDYLVWRDCAHNAWTKKWKPNIYYDSPLSEFDQHLIETGNQVEEKAREYFGNGTLIEGRDENAISKTKELLATRTPLIFQACFSDGTLFAAVDILKQGKDGELYIYEVKASNSSKSDNYGLEEDDNTEGDIVVDFKDPKAIEKYRKELLKDPHLFDLAFQIYLIRKLGYKVGGAFLVRLNRNYTRMVILDLKKLFVLEEVTKFVDEIMTTVEDEAKTMIPFLSSPKEPTGPCSCIYKGKSRHCTTFSYTNRDILSKEELKYSVHSISNIGKSHRKLKELIDSRIYDIMNIPDDFELSAKMKKQVDTHKRGKADIDHEAIREELDKLQFPLYFLDYESFNPALPRFMGFKSYQHIPFQFSLHRLDSAESKPIEIEPFFYMGKDDPSSMFVEDLKKKIGEVGTVVVWNRTFEESHINKHLAKRLPDYAPFLQSVNSRIFDLMTIFSKQLHVDPDFHGSASIKKVLPVLCSDLSYKELDIGNGSEAMNAWNKLVTEDSSESHKEEVRKAMLEYCALDTYAMYVIWNHLHEITK